MRPSGLRAVPRLPAPAPAQTMGDFVRMHARVLSLPQLTHPSSSMVTLRVLPPSFTLDPRYMPAGAWAALENRDPR